MKFTLEIELGNDAMRSYRDIREALSDVSGHIAMHKIGHVKPYDGDGRKIMDINGNSVGKWEVTE